MRFRIEKCAMLIIISGKRNMTEGIELPNQDKIRTPREKRNVQILWNIGGGQHQTSGDERKIKKEYLRRTRKLLETKLYCRNLILRKTIVKVDKKRTSTNGPVNKKTNDDAFVFAPQGWRRQTVCLKKKMKMTYEVITISFQTFFVWVFKIVVDSWKFSILLLYILWDDRPIFMIQMNSYSSNWNTPY